MRQNIDYIIGEAKIECAMPKGKISCNYCRFCRCEESMKRYSCRITGETIFNPMNSIGEHCPFDWDSETK